MNSGQGALLRFETPVDRLHGIGRARAERLRAEGLGTIGDLLLHLPLRYEDRSRVCTVESLLTAATLSAGSTPSTHSTISLDPSMGHLRLPPNTSESGKAAPKASLGLAPRQAVTVCGRLRDLRRVPIRSRGLRLVRGVLEDETGTLDVLWYNRPYLVDQVRPDLDYLLHGDLRFGPRSKRLELSNPSCEVADRARHSGRVVPVYPSRGEFGPTLLRSWIDAAAQAFDPDSVSDPMPRELRTKYGFPSLGEALVRVHRPLSGTTGDAEEGETTKAAEVDPAEDPAALNLRSSPQHGRLIYGEFLELQLELAWLRRDRQRIGKPHGYRIDAAVRAVAKEVLPFRLTGAQKRVVREIVDDLKRPEPMLRLVQGDVGSGKTIVAALAMLLALENGLQCAFMAPTELLAEQHYRNLERLLGHRFRLGLFAASNPDLAVLRRQLATGEIQIAVGTHALIQEGTDFQRLGLAVVDEQHRFGVDQRRLLEAKGQKPDVLVMTATPIPRSLALTVYGDLALSTIDELPPGRQPIVTVAGGRRDRPRIYREILKELEGGGQVFVVCPFIEASEAIEAASLEVEGEDVRRRLSPFASALLHGRLPSVERDRIMASFAAGELRVVVATTIIEVGVDVPEATVMVIESAERFGLAQLHQLRGRVGRGTRPSRCYALHRRLSEEGRQRLAVFTRTQDGFEIAEADLEIRGPGDLLGTRQAGLPEFRVADLVADRQWLERARQDAAVLMERIENGEVGELSTLIQRVDRRSRRRAAQLAAGG